MARVPLKIIRFLVWASASSEQRDDALTTFDELFENAYDEFGPVYAHWWSLSQGLRSLPYGLIVFLMKLGTSIWAMVS